MRRITNEVVDNFKKNLLLEEKSNATIEKYNRDIKHFIDFAGGCEITKETVIEYKHELISAGYADRSINSMLASLNSLFDFLGWYECKVKSIKIQKEIYCPEEKELSKNEYMRLVNTAKKNRNNRLCLILQTICGTGIRVSELQYITVEAVKKGVAKVNCKAKSRTVFIVRPLQKQLMQYAKSRGIMTGSIFVTRTGKPMSRTNIWREMKKLCKEANVNPGKVFPHNLRHLFARTFYAIEKDIAKLADILGHSSINTTRIYIISTGIEHRKCLENMRLVV